MSGPATQSSARRRWRRRRCNSCGAVVIWARTESGAPMPLNPEPAAGGNIELFAPPGTVEPIATIVRPDQDPNGARLFEVDVRERWRPHWATCPQSEEWRGRYGAPTRTPQTKQREGGS